MSELRELADFWCGEDEGIEHVVACQDYARRQCVVIACATDLRALAGPARRLHVW